MSSRPDCRWRPVWGRGAVAGVLLAACCFITASADEPWRATQHERRERLLKMDAAEKERLDRQTERFQGLPEPEKVKLREIHAELSQAPDGEQLYAVLQRYCEWLKTLNAADRAELASLPQEQRVARIRELMKHQEEQRYRRLANLSYDDTKVVLEWLDGMVKPHEEELLSLLSEDTRNFLGRFDDPRAKRKMIVWSLFREDKKDELRETLQPSPDDLQRLLAGLSQETQDEFKKLGDPQKQQDLVRSWIGWSVFPRPSFRPVSDSELHKFFTSLPTEEQAKLERLPREEMHNKLREQYYASRFRGPDGGRPGEGGRPPFRGQFRDGGSNRHERSRPDEKQPFAKPPAN